MTAIPTCLQARWDAVKHEVGWLHVRWVVYRQLYGTNSRRIELLNESAHLFFFITHNVLLDDVQLTLSKLAEGERRNLTLASLVTEVRKLGEATLTAKLETLLAEYRSSCTQMINRRNKQLAHYDLQTLLSARSAPLPGPSRKEIEDSLRVLREFMNCIENHYDHSQTAYRDPATVGDGEELVLALNQASRYAQLRRDGIIPWNDLEPRPSSIDFDAAK